MTFELSPQYAAGFIDGEGCLRAQVYKHKKGGFVTTLLVAVSHSYKKILESFKNKYGGSVLIEKIKRPNRKFRYYWQLCKRNLVIRFLMDIYPYLNEKKHQAYVLLDFCRLPRTSIKDGLYHIELMSIKIKMCQKLKILKIIQEN